MRSRIQSTWTCSRRAFSPPSSNSQKFVALCFSLSERRCTVCLQNLPSVQDKKWRVRHAIIERVPVLAKQMVRRWVFKLPSFLRINDSFSTAPQGVDFFNRKLNNLCMDWLSDNIFSVRGIGLRGADPQYHQTFTPSPPCRYPRNSCRCAKLEAPCRSFRRGVVPLQNNSPRVRVKGSHLLSATNDNDQNFKGICIVVSIDTVSKNPFPHIMQRF